MRRRRSTSITALVVALAAASPAHALDSGRRRVVTTTDIEILEPVTFVPGKIEITKSSAKTLDTIAETLRVHAQITKLAVEVTGEDGGLAEARSTWLVEELVRRGVDRARLASAPKPGAKELVAFLILKREVAE